MQLDVVLYLKGGQTADVALAALLRAAKDPAFLHVCVLGQASAVPGMEGFGALHFLPSASLNAAACGSSEWILYLDAAYATEPDFFEAVRAATEAHPDAAGFECRQLPFETEQHIDPVTLETPFLNGAAMLLHRAPFEQAGGFDPSFSGTAANIDLSWRLRAAGGPLFYLPGAVVTASATALPAETLESYAEERLSRLLLAWKYGGPGAVWQAERAYLKTLKSPQHFPGVRKRLARQYLRHFACVPALLRSRKTAREALATPPRSGLCQAASPAAPGGAFAPARGRAALPQRPADGPLISVVVRTHRRAARLRGALQSVAKQSYKNYEVIVVEDGAATAQSMVEAEFAQLPLRYHATGENVGRSRAGNLGFAMAKGDFINLLDDDDYFYPDHLELVAAQALAHPEAELIISDAMAVKQEVLSEDPFTFEAKAYAPIHIERLDVFTMAQACQVHVSGIVFKRALFEKLGGFNESMQAHEDWALWMRYLAAGRRAHPGKVDIPRATTVFTQPANPEEAARRMRQYMQSDSAFFGDPAIRFDLTLAEMRSFYDGMLADIRHVQALGQLDSYLKKQQNRDQFRD